VAVGSVGVVVTGGRVGRVVNTGVVGVGVIPTIGVSNGEGTVVKRSVGEGKSEKVGDAVTSGVGVGTGVAVICSKIASRERSGELLTATFPLVGAGVPAAMNTASVPPAKIRLASSKTPTAMMFGPRRPTRAVSRVR
jgi:hypothetical protein